MDIGGSALGPAGSLMPRLKRLCPLDRMLGIRVLELSRHVKGPRELILWFLVRGSADG
jgi:hypothetical protein